MAINNLTPSLFANYDPYGGGFSVNENARPYGNTSLMTPSFPERKEYNLIPEELVPYKGDMIENITTTGNAVSAGNAGNAGKNKQLALMLYALGGALKGDKNFVQNTMKLQQMQEGKDKEKEMKENWEKALGKIEGSVNPVLFEFAKILGPEKGTSIIASGMQKEKDKTAAMLNLEAFEAIEAGGDPEKIAIARQVLIGTRQKKSIPEMRNDLTTSLLKQKDMLGESLSEEEINTRLKLFDTLIGTQAPANNNTGSFEVGGYKVQEVK